jgi:hypothetical protein
MKIQQSLRHPRAVVQIFGLAVVHRRRSYQDDLVNLGQKTEARGRFGRTMTYAITSDVVLSRPAST